jgi:hypothetical protein
MLLSLGFSSGVYAQLQTVKQTMGADIPVPTRENTPGWRMHQIDNPQVELPNGLDVADGNKDGFPDYVTNYEGGEGDVRIAFHPGNKTRFSSPALAARQLWPAVRVCKYLNAESAAFGDMDGDGNPDVIVAHGNQAGAGEKSGVSMIWNPGPDKVMEEKAWVDGGDVPATVSKGHYLFVKTIDIDGDGALDIVVGGRREGSSARNPSPNGVLAGIKWIQSPGGSKENRRDLFKWKVYDIDASWLSGHGFILADVDGDGDIDIADGNEDWDTPKGAEEVAWFENPGKGSPAQKKPWKKNTVHQGPAFYTKTQLDVGDLDGDGHKDIVMQSETHMYYFRNSGTKPIKWQLTKIPKPEFAQQRARPTRIVDLNGDGKMDLVGVTIHRDGYLPADKAAMFWMEYSGKEPKADNWTTHVIKWGDGYNGNHVFVGEKWDQYMFYDVDGDGDLDIVANCEEYHDSRPQNKKVYLAVAWFENPGNTTSPK